MAEITLNTPCKIEKFIRQDGYGQAEYGQARDAHCAVERLQLKRRVPEGMFPDADNNWLATDHVAEMSLFISRQETVSLGDRISLESGSIAISDICYCYTSDGSLSHLKVSGHMH